MTWIHTGGGGVEVSVKLLGEFCYSWPVSKFHGHGKGEGCEIPATCDKT